MGMKPCPFCGNPAELEWINQQRDGHMNSFVVARCSVCKASTRKVPGEVIEPVQHGCEEKARNLWNRRK